MILKIKNINKEYKNGVKALNNFSIEIHSGMFGLLGPNGAGKSTLMRILATLQPVDSGSIFLGEIDVLNQKDELRRVLGYLPQEFGLYPSWSAEKFLNHLAILKGLDDTKKRKIITDNLLQKVNLFDVRKKKLKTFSGGMKQRFGIAQALLGQPKLIIVDEPTAGLDPAERNRFHNILSELAEEIIVILSTHIVEDVKDICNQMAIINAGEIRIEGSPNVLVSEIKGKIWEKNIEKTELNIHENQMEVISSQLKGGKKLIHVYSDTKPDSSFNEITPTLEDLYFHILGNKNN